MENGSVVCIGLIFQVIIIINTGQITENKCLKVSERNQRQAETGGDKILEGSWHTGAEPRLLGFSSEGTSQFTKSTGE